MQSSKAVNLYTGVWYINQTNVKSLEDRMIKLDTTVDTLIYTLLMIVRSNSILFIRIRNVEQIFYYLCYKLLS